MSAKLLWVLGLSVFLGGCQEVALVDDVDLELDWNILDGPSDALHTPYVAGSRFNVYIDTRKRESLNGWRIESGDGQVLEVGQPVLSSNHEQLHASVKALGVGSVELRVRDDSGGLRHTRLVDVRLPDRVEVLAHGPLLIGRPDDAPTARPQILANGTATFLARYYAGGELLSGNGALQVAAQGDTVADVKQSYLFEDRDWLALTPHAGGDVDLKVLDTTINRLPVAVMPESAIDRIELLGENEADAASHEWLVVLAQAYAADGSPIYGAEYEFAANGVQALSEGDLYRYKFDDHKPVMLEATHGAHVNGVLIHSGGGYVDSTNRIGCEMAQSEQGGSAAALLVFAMLLVGRARRRFSLAR